MTQANDNKPKGKAPTHIIWQVVEQRGRKDRFIRVGAAWLNRDGKGLNLVFESYPIVGRTVVREIGQSEADRSEEQKP